VQQKIKKSQMLSSIDGEFATKTKRYARLFKHSFHRSSRERPTTRYGKKEEWMVIITTNKALKALSEIKVELICQKLPFSIQI
jgi:hypothetical protein